MSPCEIIGNAIVCFSRKAKPGDLPPTGYNDWHEWVNVQYKAELRQVACGICGKVKFPQELSSDTIESKYRQTKDGPELLRTQPVCLDCFSRGGPLFVGVG